MKKYSEIYATGNNMNIDKSHNEREMINGTKLLIFMYIKLQNIPHTIAAIINIKFNEQT